MNELQMMMLELKSMAERMNAESISVTIGGLKDAGLAGWSATISLFNSPSIEDVEVIR